MIKSIVRCRSWSKLSVVFIFFVAVIIVFSSCGPTPAEPPISEYIEKQSTVVTGEIYRLNIFVNEGETITGYWKADNTLYCWYTDSRGSAKTMTDYGIGPDGERVIGVREPGLKEYPCLRIADADGHYLRDESMDGSNGNAIQIEAGEPGYYSLCFYIFDEDVKSVDVTIHCQVK